jgi:preprotein translocase subunit SecA
MILRLARRVFGSSADRRLTRYGQTTKEILAIAPEHRSLSPAALRQRTQDLREKAMAGVSLDDLAIPLFALVREAARRSLGEEHLPEQLICGLALQHGCIARK